MSVVEIKTYRHSCDLCGLEVISNSIINPEDWVDTYTMREVSTYDYYNDRTQVWWGSHPITVCPTCFVTYDDEFVTWTEALAKEKLLRVED